MQWLLIGGPTFLNFKILNVVNIELMYVNFFLYRSRLSKKLPTIRDFKFYMSWNRALLLRNSYYAQGFAKFNLTIDNG